MKTNSTHHSGKIVLPYADLGYISVLEKALEFLSNLYYQKAKSPSFKFSISHWLWRLSSGQHSWMKIMARPCPAGSSTVLFFNLPNLFLPTLALLCPKPTIQSDHTVIYEVFLSGVHQCVPSSSGKCRDGTTQDINLLIWPWWHAYSTHSPPQSSFPHPFLLLPSPWALFLVTHTLFWVCCACSMSLNIALVCSSNRIVVASYIPEAIAVSVSTETFKLLEEVVGSRLKDNQLNNLLGWVARYILFYIYNTQA